MTLLDSRGVPVSLSQSLHGQCREWLRRAMMREHMTGPDIAGLVGPADSPAGEADHQLVRRVLDGDAAARLAIVDRIACLPAMVRLKHLRMGSPLQPDELDDAIQNVLLAFWRKLDRFDGRVPLLVWAHGFGAVELVKAVERRARRRQRFRAVEEEPAAPNPPGYDTERIGLILAAEPEADALLIRLKHFEGCTFEEIAPRTGMPVNTVKTRYYRCLERLRRRLRGSAEED
jgi:RNA polymerase sigma-70 factor (ECF subfamily)